MNLAAPRSGEGRTLDYGLTANLLPLWTGRDYGLALDASVSVAAPLLLPGGPGEELEVPRLSREQVRLAARLPAGGTLAVAGLGNPFAERTFDPRPGLLLLVRVSGAVAEETPAPAADGGTGRVAVDLHGLDSAPADAPAPPFRGAPPRPVESRTTFLLTHLREKLGAELLGRADASLTLGRGVVWVQGDAELRSRVGEVVEGLVGGLPHVIRLGVRAVQVSAEEESTLLRALTPGGTVVEGDGVRTFLLVGEERERLGYYAAGARGRFALLNEEAAARSTQLVNLARVTRHTFLTDLRTAGGEQAWPVYGAADEGLTVEARPVFESAGRVDLVVTARVARILGEPVSGQAPVQAVTSTQVRAALSPEQTLLVAGLPAPGPVAERRDRLVLFLTATGD